MFKTGKIILFALSFVFAPLVIIFAVYVVRFQIEAEKMSPLPTAYVTDNIIAVKDTYVNLFLLENNGKYIAVDAGNNRNNILKELKKLEISPDDVIAVLLTHSDKDHTAGISLFKNARIYLPEDEVQMINGKTSRFAFFKNKLKADYDTMSHSEVLYFDGFVIECIKTPGHTPGSMVFKVNNTYLFTGDSMSLKDGYVDTFNDFFNMDTEKQKESIDNLVFITMGTQIFTAHYGYNPDHAKAFSKWLSEDR